MEHYESYYARAFIATGHFPCTSKWNISIKTEIFFLIYFVNSLLYSEKNIHKSYRIAILALHFKFECTAKNTFLDL